MGDDMKVEYIKTGFLGENCYLISKNNCYLLVDPGEDLDEILKFIDGKNVIGILVTHHHMDHVFSLDSLVDKYHYPVYRFDNLKEGNIKIGCFDIEINSLEVKSIVGFLKGLLVGVI